MQQIFGEYPFFTIFALNLNRSTPRNGNISVAKIQKKVELYQELKIKNYGSKSSV